MSLSIVRGSSSPEDDSVVCRGYEQWGEQLEGSGSNDGCASSPSSCYDRDMTLMMGRDQEAGRTAAALLRRTRQVRAAARGAKRFASPFDPVVVEVVKRALSEMEGM